MQKTLNYVSPSWILTLFILQLGFKDAFKYYSFVSICNGFVIKIFMI